MGHDAAPISDAIERFHARGDLSFGIPAHRSVHSDIVNDAETVLGAEIFHADVGMNKGVDTRHQDREVEPTAMELFADAVGADLTLFSTNGSSMNVHVALLAAAHPGDTMVLARNGHESAFAALALGGVRPVYAEPTYDERWQVAHGVAPAAVERSLDAAPDARAVLIFTPSYYGVGSDVRSIADLAHARDGRRRRRRAARPLSRHGLVLAGARLGHAAMPRRLGAVG